MWTIYRRLIKPALWCSCAMMLPACTSLDLMAKDFETRWNNPQAILEGSVAAEPTPEELAQIEAQNTATLEQAGLALNSQDCEAIRAIAFKVFAVEEDHNETRLGLAECALSDRDLATARSRFREALNATGDARAERGLGIAALLDGKPDQARERLARASTRLGDDWRTWNGLGFAEDSLGNWAAAEAAYLTAARLNASEVGPLNNLGMSYIRQDRYSDAIEVLQRGLKIDNRSQIMRLNLRLAHALDGHIGTALSGANDTERAIIYNTIGVSALSGGRREYARQMFNQALTAHPGFYARAYENLERTRFMDLDEGG